MYGRYENIRRILNFYVSQYVDFKLLKMIFVGCSSRMVGLVQLLLKSNAASSLVEDYASCLELRSEECHTIENSGDDPGVLIMQVLYWHSFTAKFYFLFLVTENLRSLDLLNQLDHKP